MLDLSVCPVCDSEAIDRIGSHRSEIIDPPLDIRQAGWNVVLSYVLHRVSLVVSTFVCRACSHVFLSPTFDSVELNRFYSAECELETKRQYRISERVSGRSWAEQNQIDPNDQANLLQEAYAYRKKRLAEIVESVTGRPCTSICRICDVGGQSGELTAEFTCSQRFVYDKDATKVDDPRVTVLKSMEQVVQNAPYDLIVLSHVLEHVPLPVELLLSLNRLLLPADGIIYVEVPLEYCGALIKRRGIPLGAHVNYFTKRSLLVALKRSGLGSIKFVCREIVPYRELRRPVIKIVASKGSGGEATTRQWPGLVELIIDSFLVFKARKSPPRFTQLDGANLRMHAAYSE